MIQYGATGADSYNQYYEVYDRHNEQDYQESYIAGVCVTRGCHNQAYDGKN